MKNNQKEQSKHLHASTKPKIILLPEALRKLQRQYNYNDETEIYEDISCCWEVLTFDNFFQCVEHGKCPKCEKSLTRKALLWDACFITTTITAWLCDDDFNPIDDLGIKTLNIDKSIISADGYFEHNGEKYLYYGDHKQVG